MKYLILVIISLFCLTSFSDHKKTTSISEEEKNRHEELHKEKPRSSWSEEEKKEHEKIHHKIDEREFLLKRHFNRYMELEFDLFEAEKGNILAQYFFVSKFKRDHFNIVNPYVRIKIDEKNPIAGSDIVSAYELLPDCTKERLEKKQCPKPPHLAIYWAKRALFEGKCINYSAPDLYILINSLVIPKTDIRGHESLFFTLNYMSFYLFIKASKFRSLKENEGLDPKWEAIDRRRIESINKDMKELRNNLSEKDQIKADKWIESLIKKWSKKYTKDQIYGYKECSPQEFYNRDNDIFLREKFLEEYYPHLD